MHYTIRMKHDLLKDARILDTIFLSEAEAQALDHVIDSTPHHSLTEALSAVSGINNPVVLDLMVKNGVTPRTLASLVVVPLVEVAWADGSFHAKEHAAIMKGLEETPLTKAVDRAILSEWVRRQPNPLLLGAWKALVSDLCSLLGTGQVAVLKQEIMRFARMVADAEGGFLGIGATSREEQAMLAELDASFTY